MNEKSFERKKELIMAALDEFAHKSYEKASLNTIIKNAGISKGTFYYHFQDKQSLYFYLLETAVKAKWDFIDEKTRKKPEYTGDTNIFEEFKLQAQIGMEFAHLFPQYHRLSIMFAQEKGNDIYENAKTLLKFNTESVIRSMVKKAMEKGELNNRFSEDFIVRILTHLFMNFDEIFSLENDFSQEKMVENLNNYVDFMKNGMKK